MARAILLLAFALIVLRHGWVVDDAYITLRTVDNLFEGRGLVWNTGERVQAYTHPLWMLLVCCVYAVTDEFFYSLIVLGTVVSTVALGLVSVRLARSEYVGAALIVLALLSHAFVDYSTGGLENPLSHLLFAIAAWVYLGRVPGVRRFGLLWMLGGLAILTRPDNAVLLAPMVVTAGVQAWRHGSQLRALARAAALASIPWLCWELFSLFYYGLLVPNTALAKLNTGIPAGELIAQGSFYLLASLDADPLTLLVILAGIAVPIVTRDRRTLPLAVGIGLHVIYVISIGGDFMLGRFLTGPLFMSLIVLSQLRGLGPVRVGALTVVFAALGLSSSPSTLAVNTATTPDRSTARTDRRVTDERVLFFEGASLLSAYRTRDMPDHKWRWMGERGAKDGKRTITAIAMGYRGWAAGPDVHVIDRAALTDPLLSRLPPLHDPRWMTGHFLRVVPPGYVDTLETGVNHLQDPRLAELYDRVRLVVSGPLWSRERLAAIWWLNTGGPESLIREEHYRFHGARKLKPEELAKPVPDGSKRSAKGVHKLSARGAHIKFAARQHPHSLQISLNSDDRFELRFYDGNKELARVPVPRAPKWGEGDMTTRTVELPEELHARGFTRMRVLPRTQVGKKKSWAIGQLSFDGDRLAGG